MQASVTKRDVNTSLIISRVQSSLSSNAHCNPLLEVDYFNAHSLNAHLV